MNCKLNERSFFSLPQVKDEFAKYVLLKLYTDTIPLEYYSKEQLIDTKKTIEDRQSDDVEAHKKFQKTRFDTTQLPLYAIIEPVGDDFKVVAKYPLAVIRNAGDFAAFLRINASP